MWREIKPRMDFINSSQTHGFMILSLSLDLQIKLEISFRI